MRLIVPIIAGLWMFVAAVQGVAFLVQYGLLPLPPEIGRVDFTPQYTLLMALVIIAAVVARLPSAAASDETEKRGSK